MIYSECETLFIIHIRVTGNECFFDYLAVKDMLLAKFLNISQVVIHVSVNMQCVVISREYQSLRLSVSHFGDRAQHYSYRNSILEIPVLL